MSDNGYVVGGRPLLPDFPADAPTVSAAEYARVEDEARRGLRPRDRSGHPYHPDWPGAELDLEMNLSASSVLCTGCGERIRRLHQAEGYDLSEFTWTHGLSGVMCDNGWLDDAGDWHDATYATPPADTPTPASVEGA